MISQIMCQRGGEFCEDGEVKPASLAPKRAFGANSTFIADESNLVVTL